MTESLQKELNKLTKDELICLFNNQGLFLRTTMRDIYQVKIDRLSLKAEKDSLSALDEMDKWNGKDHAKWLKANEKWEKAIKIYDEIDLLFKKSSEALDNAL